MAKQVWGIAVVSILIWIGAAVTLVGAASSFFFGSTISSMGLSIGLPDFSGYLTWAAWIGAVIAILYIVLGAFLWMHNKWAWRITFGLNVVSLLLLIPAFLAFSWMVLFGLLLPVLVLVMLTNESSMEKCKVKLAGWNGW